MRHLKILYNQIFKLCFFIFSMSFYKLDIYNNHVKTTPQVVEQSLFLFFFFFKMEICTVL